MSLETLRERWERHIGPFVTLSFDAAVEVLRGEGVLVEDRMDLLGLNDVVSNGSPVERARRRSGLTIATIHRSKGLEFDEVLLYQPSDTFVGRAEEVRTVYVAATRAKQRLRILARDLEVKRGEKTGHGLITSHFRIWNYAPPQLCGLLVDGADEIDVKQTLLVRDPEASRELNVFLWDQGAQRIPRDVVIERAADGGAARVLIAGREVGRVTNRLNDDLNAIARAKRGRFSRLAGIRLVDVASQAYERAHPASQEAFGAACLGLVPVLSGLGRIIVD
jgi:hypothetical protein